MSALERLEIRFSFLPTMVGAVTKHSSDNTYILESGQYLTLPKFKSCISPWSITAIWINYSTLIGSVMSTFLSYTAVKYVALFVRFLLTPQKLWKDMLKQRWQSKISLLRAVFLSGLVSRHPFDTSEINCS